jgi:L-amino acid N-acyltransferase YncA
MPRRPRAAQPGRAPSRATDRRAVPLRGAGGCPGPHGPTGTLAGVLLRLARPSDAEAVREIYNTEVTGSTVTFDMVPRSLEEQRQWLEARAGALAVVVAEDDGVVVGFASISPYRDRPAYSTTVEDSVYVRRDQRGKGLGRALLAEIVDVAAKQGFHTVMARIVGHHDASIELHRSLGFEVVGVEKEVGRKFNRWLDVVVMQRML